MVFERELEASKRALDVARAEHELAISLHDEVLLSRLTAKARLRTAHQGLLAAIVNHRKVSDLAEAEARVRDV